MRADELYRRLVKQEAEIAKAKEEGRPIPQFPSIMQPERTAAAPVTVTLPQGTGTTTTTLPAEPDAEMVEAWKSKLNGEKMSEADRAAELEALRGEYRAKIEMARQVERLKEEHAREREARKAEGKETMGDRIKSIFGN